MLSWGQSQREAAFRAMDRLPVLARWSTVTPSPTPLPLPVGKPLTIPGVDDYMRTQNTAGLVVLQDGKVRFERYGLGFDAAGRWTSFSVPKSFTSTLVGAAVQDGHIKSLEDKVSRYIPGLRGSAYDDVTVRQLLTMSSGVRWNEDDEDPKADVARFNNAEPEPGMDATVSYMRKLPRAHPAGMEAMATWLQGRTGHGIAGCCLQAATRDYARFGLFVLANGAAATVSSGGPTTTVRSPHRASKAKASTSTRSAGWSSPATPTGRARRRERGPYFSTGRPCDCQPG